MATAEEKTTPCCTPKRPSLHREPTSTTITTKPTSTTTTNAAVVQDWTVVSSGRCPDKKDALSPLMHPADPAADPPANASSKGIQVMMRAQTSHPLDPLSAAEISVAVATVRAAGATPEVRDSMRFIEVDLWEPDKNVVALADAYFFPPFQPSLLPKTKGGPVIPTKLPPRRARLIVYNKKTNETSIWIVELSEVHAATRGGHHRGKVISSEVVPDVQPPMLEHSTPVSNINSLLMLFCFLVWIIL